MEDNPKIPENTPPPPPPKINPPRGPQSKPSLVVGIRFQKLGKAYHFDASAFPQVKVGDHAVVRTKRGRQLGQIVQIVDPETAPKDGSLRPMERIATAKDMVMRQTWQQRELEVTITCRAAVSEAGLRDIKVISSEFSFDGKNLAVMYSYELEGKPDLKPIRQAAQALHPKANVELHLIGPRDVARILGGLGACGLETRCCSKFLTEFSPISIKMAKAQGISLNPSEITGMCGRLRCCLIYEYEQYVEARKTLPKQNKRVVTPRGEGKVLDVYPLKQSVIVEILEVGRFEFMKHEIEPWDELEALRRKSEAPCDRHESGGCDCGKARPKNQ